MRRSPLINREPIAFIGDGATWPTERPDGDPLIRGDLMVFQDDPGSGDSDVVVYALENPDDPSNLGPGDPSDPGFYAMNSWVEVRLEYAGWQRANLVRNLSDDLFFRWIRR